jgi:hypothetical protein
MIEYSTGILLGNEQDLHITERVRLETLIARVGIEASREWARWAASLYRQSLNNPAHYASQAEKRPLFEESISQLERFVDKGVVPDVSRPCGRREPRNSD